MKRPFFRHVKKIEPTPGERYRETVTLECGHEIVQAIRPQPRRNVYCPECADAT